MSLFSMFTSTASATASRCGVRGARWPICWTSHCVAHHRCAGTSCPSPASYARGRGQSQGPQVFPAQLRWDAASNVSEGMCWRGRWYPLLPHHPFALPLPSRRVKAMKRLNRNTKQNWPTNITLCFSFWKTDCSSAKKIWIFLGLFTALLKLTVFQWSIHMPHHSLVNLMARCSQLNQQCYSKHWCAVWGMVCSHVYCGKRNSLTTLY